MVAAVLPVRSAVTSQFMPAAPYLGQNATMHVAVNDFHIPYHDQRLMVEFKKFVHTHQPRVIHILGDLLDCYAVSKFSKDPARLLSLQDEFDQGTEFLRELRELCPSTIISFVEGNHEARLQKFLCSQAPQLKSLRCLDVRQQLKLAENRIWWWAENSFYRWKHLFYTHGLYVRKHSGVAAKEHFEQFGGCVIHGHGHRFGTYYRTTLRDTFACWENGCMADPKQQDYCPIANWQQGWSVVWHIGNRFHVDQIVVIDGAYVYHGKEYGVAEPSGDFRRMPDMAEMSLSV